MRTLFFIAVFLTSPLFTIAGEQPQQSDAEICQKIVGTWIMDVETKGHTYSARGAVTYSTNGYFVAQAKVTEEGKVHDERFEGFWHVESGILTDTVTNSVGMRGGSPKNFELARVVKVDETELILESGKKTKIREIEKRSK